MFFKKKDNNQKEDFLVKICALLIHAAKIDQDYTQKEEDIIKKTLLELGLKKENLNNTIKEAKIIEDNSNQILDFTREVKSLSDQKKN